ncbi:MAG: NADH-quinone oxidoreductase subunit NuoF [Deltaproteobacteria bacterium]|nr:NADH-quinone oxidoreductase subunit NuoF [Deltaproteobacteria bacterium]
MLRCGPGEDILDLDRHLATGGFEAVKKALDMQPDAVREEVKKGNLRGRGGAGFPAGVKWGFIPADNPKPRYLLVNADEGEPGTFKDRYFLEHDPFPLLEGIIISAYAIGANTSYIYVRGEFVKQIRILEDCIAQLYKSGYLGEKVLGRDYKLDIYVHPGAGAYICGEESALMESIEGKPGRPRNRPPFPAVVGLFGCPTIINNVETMACVSLVFRHGAEKFVQMGLEKDGGPKIYCLSGHLKKPGLYEAPMGTNLKTLIYDYAGGTLDDRPIKGVIPGGSSTPVLTADEIDISMDFSSLAAAGTMLGSGATIVFTEGTCPVAVLKRISQFYAHESCGQCTPCRSGTGWLSRIVDSIESGNGRAGDCDLLLDAAGNISGNTICALGDAAAMPVTSFVTKFRDEFERHIAEGRCPYGN